MKDTDTLNDLAKAEIEALEREGIRLTPSEIVELNGLGWAVEKPELRVALARGVPVFLCGVVLWPLTLYAEDWYKREGLKLRGAMQDFALAYAMANAYDEKALEIGGREAEKIIKEWAKGLRCRVKQLSEAVAQVLLQDTRPPVPQGVGEENLTDGEFSIYLSKLTDTEPEFWERRCSVGYARSMLIAAFMQNRAEGQPCSEDPRILADRALGLKVEEIRARHSNG